MKIKRLLEDPKGTFVSFADGSRYDFTPDSPLGPYVAEVSNDQHADRLLSLSYAYREVTGEGTADAEAAEQAEAAARAQADAEAAAAAQAKADAMAAEDTQHAVQAAAAASQAISLDDMSDDELRDHYLQTVGKKPHHNAGRDKLIQQIQAALTAE